MRCLFPGWDVTRLFLLLLLLLLLLRRGGGGGREERGGRGAILLLGGGRGRGGEQREFSAAFHYDLGGPVEEGGEGGRKGERVV